MRREVDRPLVTTVRPSAAPGEGTVSTALAVGVVVPCGPPGAVGTDGSPTLDEDGGGSLIATIDGHGPRTDGAS